MKLEDITAEQIDAWLNSQFDKAKTQKMEDHWTANISTQLELSPSMARTTEFTQVLVMITALQKHNPRSAILAFGICLGIKFATDTANNAKEDVKCQTLQ